MWFALLFSSQDELLAAAPAAPVYELGRDYWRDIYAGEVSFGTGCQTAYVDIKDDQLIEKLNSLETSDDLLMDCRSQINELTSTFRRVARQTARPKAA